MKEFFEWAMEELQWAFEIVVMILGFIIVMLAVKGCDYVSKL